jgi:hypothetical protein
VLKGVGKAPRNARLLQVGPRAVGQGDGSSHFHIGPHIGAQRFGRAAVGVGKRGHKALGPQYVKGAVGLGQVQRHRLAARHQAAQGLHPVAEGLADACVHGAHPKVFGKAHAQGGQVGRTQRPEVARRCVVGQRVAPVQAHAGLHHESCVFHRAAHGAQHRDADQPSGRARLATSPGDGPHAHHAAQRRRNAQRAAGVRAGAQRQQIGGQRRGRAARRAAGIQQRVERVAGGTPHRRCGCWRPRPCRARWSWQVTMAPAARSRATRLLSCRRHMAAQAHVAAGGQQAGRVQQVLHAQRQAVQQAQGGAAATACSACPRPVPGRARSRWPQWR